MAGRLPHSTGVLRPPLHTDAFKDKISQLNCAAPITACRGGGISKVTLKPKRYNIGAMDKFSVS
jgi:hypothetical protein